MRLRPPVVMLVVTIVFSTAAIIAAQTWDPYAQDAWDTVPEDLPAQTMSVPRGEARASAGPSIPKGTVPTSENDLRATTEDGGAESSEGSGHPPPEDHVFPEEPAEQLLQAARQWGVDVSREFVQGGEIDRLPADQKVLQSALARRLCGSDEGPCILEVQTPGNGTDWAVTAKLMLLASQSALEGLERLASQEMINGRRDRMVKINRLLYDYDYLDGSLP